MTEALSNAQAYAEKWIELIHKPSLSEAEAKAVIDESKYNFAEHFNKGWLEYRRGTGHAWSGLVQVLFLKMYLVGSISIAWAAMA